jgi:hypothetical protein
VLELSLHVLDVLQNSVEAGATQVRLEVNEDLRADRLEIVVTDNGKGMDPEMTARVFDPFVTTRKTRHIGLGIPLFAEAARSCNGDLEIESIPGKGTRLRADFQHSHLDRMPLGDMPSILLVTLLAPRVMDIEYIHRINQEEFVFRSAEAREVLGDVPFSQSEVRAWLEETLREGEADLKEVVLNHG